MRVLPGTHIVRVITGHDGGASARWCRAGAVAAALALPLAVSGIAATPASAARGGYRVTHTIPVGGFPEAEAVDPAARTAYVTNDQDRSVS
jgi:DNA-binding beta-propeller fold protein YncE